MIEVYTFPSSIFPDGQRLVPDVPGQKLEEGDFNGAQSVITFRGGERWRLHMTFGDLTGLDRGRMTAFATKLRVSRNAFLCVHHTAGQNGVLTGTPMVGASSLNGSVLVVGNLADTASWALAGDFCSVNCELKMILEDTPVVSTIASLSIWPPLRQIPASGTNVIVNSPVGAFRLVRATEFNTEPPEYITSMTIEAVERVNSSMVMDL